MTTGAAAEHVAALSRAYDALGAKAARGVPLGPLTTYRVGGAAELFVQAETVTDLALVSSALDVSGLDVLVLGRGSNLLVADAGFAGIVVTLAGAFESVELDDATVRAGGAAALPVVARRCTAAGLRGFEWAVGVPGSIGGAVRMNAGGHGSDMAAALQRVRLFDLRTGEDGVVDVTALDLGYRRSALRDDQVVVHAELALESGDRDSSQAQLTQIVQWRRANQPGGANAGSVFTNPEGDSAGRLIDVSGCRGLRYGTAQVSDKHANFIQADDGGRSDDVAALMDLVRTRVREATGHDLVAETRMVGFAGTPG